MIIVSGGIYVRPGTVEELGVIKRRV